MLVGMDERQKLVDDLARYLTLRGLTTDERTIRAIDEMIRKVEDRLDEIDRSPEHSKPN
jgi:hypothetical protein